VGAEALELGQPSPLRGVVVGVAEGQRRLVRAAHRGPALGRPLVVAGQLEAERLGDEVAPKGSTMPARPRQR